MILVGLYLLYEAAIRFAEPQPIAGWTVVIVAGIALIVDVVTALLTYALSKESITSAPHSCTTWRMRSVPSASSSPVR